MTDVFFRGRKVGYVDKDIIKLIAGKEVRFEIIQGKLFLSIK